MPLTFTLLTTEEAAAVLGIDFKRLQRAMHGGHLPFPSHRVGGIYLWSPGDIDAARQLLPTLRYGRGRPRKDEKRKAVPA